MAKHSRTRRDANLIEGHRQRIQVTKLIDRLQDNACGELKDSEGNPTSMTPEQIRSASILLNKALPNLQSVELGGADGSPLQVQLVSFLDKVKRKGHVANRVDRAREEAEAEDEGG